MAVRAGQSKYIEPLIKAGADIHAKYLNYEPRERSSARSPRRIRCFTAFAVAITEFVHSLRDEPSYYSRRFRFGYIPEAERVERMSRHYLSVLSELLSNGIDPREPQLSPLDFEDFSDEWPRSVAHSLRPEYLLRDWPSMAKQYYEIIRSYYPETMFYEGDIYWDATDTIGK